MAVERLSPSATTTTTTTMTMVMTTTKAVVKLVVLGWMMLGGPGGTKAHCQGRPSSLRNTRRLEEVTEDNVLEVNNDEGTDATEMISEEAEAPNEFAAEAATKAGATEAAIILEPAAAPSTTASKLDGRNHNDTTTTTTTTTSSSNVNLNLNLTHISLTACEQIELAVSFLTSLDFDQTFLNLTLVMADRASTTRSDNSDNINNKSQRRRQKRAYLWDVYLLQILMTPLSLAMVLWGSHLLLPACCLAAAGLGVVLVFHLVEYLSKSSSLWLSTLFVEHFDCQMKLALSVICASLSAMAASTFVRFGLFSFGALAAGGGAYLVLDAFPFLDPTREAVLHQPVDDSTTTIDTVSLHGWDNDDSELSPFGWVVTIVLAVCGGIFLRWYEQASLEVVTALMGGVGCAYSLHSFVIIQGGQLNRSLVFLIANLIGIFGT